MSLISGQPPSCKNGRFTPPRHKKTSESPWQDVGVEFSSLMVVCLDHRCKQRLLARLPYRMGVTLGREPAMVRGMGGQSVIKLYYSQHGSAFPHTTLRVARLTGLVVCCRSQPARGYTPLCRTVGQLYVRPHRHPHHHTTRRPERALPPHRPDGDMGRESGKHTSGCSSWC